MILQQKRNQRYTMNINVLSQDEDQEEEIFIEQDLDLQASYDEPFSMNINDPGE